MTTFFVYVLLKFLSFEKLACFPPAFTSLVVEEEMLSPSKSQLGLQLDHSACEFHLVQATVS